MQKIKNLREKKQIIRGPGNCWNGFVSNNVGKLSATASRGSRGTRSPSPVFSFLAVLATYI